MNTSEYTLAGLTLATTQMDAMRAFYAQVFQIQFEEVTMSGRSLYSGDWGGLKLLLCPADLAGIQADQNRHQFDIVVFDLSKTIEQALLHGGMQLGEITEDEKAWSVGMYDPDKNSLVFKQMKL